jgi:CRP-like cAMP-binding protein
MAQARQTSHDRYTDVLTPGGPNDRLALPSTASSAYVTRVSKPTIQLRNDILLQLPPGDRDTLLAEAERIRVPAGGTLARAGDDIASTYFPDAGVISVVSEMATGHQVAVAAVGREGLLGLGPLLSVPRYPHRLVAVVDSHGYRVHTDRFTYVFEHSELVRRVTLQALGRALVELMTSAACHRVHSHRQRLARWLLLMTDKAGQRSLRVTHETLAQMVGGPRHAVTVALNDLRAEGAVAYLRGRIDIRRRSVLVAQACECYIAHAALTRL